MIRDVLLYFAQDEALAGIVGTDEDGHTLRRNVEGFGQLGEFQRNGLEHVWPPLLRAHEFNIAAKHNRKFLQFARRGFSWLASSEFGPAPTHVAWRIAPAINNRTRLNSISYDR